MQVILDGNRMVSREALHEYLRETLNLPDYYGRNLDALYDLLAEISVPVTVTLVNSRLLDALGNYGANVIRVLQDAAADNPSLNVLIS